MSLKLIIFEIESNIYWCKGTKALKLQEVGNFEQIYLNQYSPLVLESTTILSEITSTLIFVKQCLYLSPLRKKLQGKNRKKLKNVNF